MSTILLRRILLLVCAGCLSTTALAAEVLWDGGGGPETPFWGIAANWDTDTVPTSADTARIGVNDVAVVIPAGESYATDTWHVAHYANNTLYVAPGATLTASGRSYVAREGGQSIGVLTIDGTVSGGQISVTGGGGADATIIVNEGGRIINNSLMLFGSWGGGQSGTLVLNGGLVDSGQFGAYLSLCNVTVDLNDGVYDSGYLNPAVLGLYDNANGSLLVDIDHGTWLINGNRTTDVATMLGRGEIVGFGGVGTISYDYDVTTPGKTTVYATHPLNFSPAYNSVVQVSDGATLEWDNYVDPNHAGATVTVDVWFGTDPNKLGANYSKVVDGQVVTPGTRGSSGPQALVAETTYYWQVDFDNGGPSIIEGPVLKFLAIDNTQPAVSVQNVSAWLDEGTGEAVILMDATVVDDTPGITYAWTLSPAGDPNVAIDSTTIEDPTLTINATGVWDATLTVDDGYWVESATAQVAVSANPCEAARQAGIPDPVGDITGDCAADIADLEALALDWMDDTRLTENLYF